MSTRHLSTGSTLLNLGLSDDPAWGFERGKYYFIVGDSASGKTLLIMTCLAEAACNRRFRDYDIVYDGPEDGCLINLATMFSQKVADRIQSPQRENGRPVSSRTIEEFYFNLDDRLKAGRPFIWVLDSMDALDSEAAEDKFQKRKKAYRQGKDEAGSYGDGKAKANSEHLRRVVGLLPKTGSILIILSQTRDNIGYGFERRTRAGGRALRFYATAEMWSSVVRPLRKYIGGKEREIGVRVKFDIRKNRHTGKRFDVELDLFPSYGVDDLGSLVDFLIEEGVFTKAKQTITAKGLGITAAREKLIRTIEQKSLESKLASLAATCWHKVQDACALHRKKRYE